MLDPRLLRNELEATARELGRRGVKLDVEKIAGQEARRKELQVAQQELQNLRNSRSKQIGKAKGAGEDIRPLLDEVAELGGKLKAAQEDLAGIQGELGDISLGVPNVPHPDVPDGMDETANREERRWGDPPGFDFEPLDHVELGARGGWMDFDAAARIAGSRFVTLHGPLARMHRALAQFMLDTHAGEHGYTETYVPFLVNPDSLRGTGQLPKFEQDLFALEGEHSFYLIPHRRGAGHESGA